MRLCLVVVVGSLATSVASLGCGGSGGQPGGSNHPGDAGDAGEDVAAGDAEPSDDGASSSDGISGHYPAFVPDIGKIENQGGAILASPRIVTVTFSGDSSTNAVQDFGDKIGPSKYWTVMKEYGVTSATSGDASHVVITTPPPSPWDDSAIDTWVTDQLSSPATSMWPAPDAQTIYVVYTPENVQVTSGGSDACASYSGYHTELTVGQLPHVMYALVVGECAASQSLSLQDSNTSTAAHEIAETATDPHASSDLAWTGFDEAHWAWEIWNDGQDEIADACQNYLDAYYTEGADLPYAVQRLWSNASAAAGHNPCVPLEAGAFFSVTPLAMDQMTVVVGSPSLAPARVTTKGYRITPGQSRTFAVGLYSDAPTSTWSVDAVEGDGMSPPTTSALDITLDKTSGNNGDTINVTVKVKAAPPGETGVLMTIVSTQGQLTHSTPLLVGAY